MPVIFVQQTRECRFQIFHQLSLRTVCMPCDFLLAVVFATSTGRRGIGRGFDIFRKIAFKFPTPGKNVRSNITKFSTPRNAFWPRARTKIQISLPPGQQENSNALPPGLSDRSKSRPMPRFHPPPPRRLDIDRCITRCFNRSLFYPAEVIFSSKSRKESLE